MHGTPPVLLAGLMLTAALGCTAVDLAAQAMEVEPGTRIRVLTHDRQKIVGTFSGIFSDTLLLIPARSGTFVPTMRDAARNVRLPLASARLIQVSEGSRTGSWAILGFAIGGVSVGGIVWMMCTQVDDCPRPTVPLLYGVPSGVLGAGIGALIGAVSGERWRTFLGPVVEPRS